LKNYIELYKRQSERQGFAVQPELATSKAISKVLSALENFKLGAS
jgi:hypothetical protein